MSTHRLPVLGSGLRRFEDPEQSRDVRIRGLVAELRALSPDAVAPAPRADFRRELRTQLVAITPRLVAEGAAEAVPPLATNGTVNGTAAKPAAPERASAPAKERIGFGRPLRIAGAVLTVCLLILGGATWASQRALPGDTLYGLKRATESVRLAFAGNDISRARLYLGFAGTRVEEAMALVGRSLPGAAGISASGGLSGSAAEEVRDTLGSANSDVRAASRLLSSQAQRSRSSAPLSTLRRWAPSQLRRLHQLAGMLPSGGLRNYTKTSASLVKRVSAHAAALSRTVSRSKPSSPTGRPNRTPGPRRHSSTPATGPSVTTGNRGSGGNNGTSGAPHPVSSQPGGPRDRSTSPQLPLPTLPLPTLTIPSLSLPVSLPASVGAGCASLPIGVRLGNCSGS